MLTYRSVQYGAFLDSGDEQPATNTACVVDDQDSELDPDTCDFNANSIILQKEKKTRVKGPQHLLIK